MDRILRRHPSARSGRLAELAVIPPMKKSALRQYPLQANEDTLAEAMGTGAAMI